MSMTMEQVVTQLLQELFTLRAQVAAESGLADAVRAINNLATAQVRKDTPSLIDENGLGQLSAQPLVGHCSVTQRPVRWPPLKWRQELLGRHCAKPVSTCTQGVPALDSLSVEETREPTGRTNLASVTGHVCVFMCILFLKGTASWTRRLGGIRQRAHHSASGNEGQIRLASASPEHGLSLQDTAPVLQGSDRRRTLGG